MTYLIIFTIAAFVIILVYTQHLRAQLGDFIANGPDWYEVPQLHEVSAEMQNQLEQYGIQDYPSGGPAEAYLAMTSDHARTICRANAQDETLTWADVTLEEFAEALDAGNDLTKRAALVQLAAVVVTWIENIDVRRAENE